MKALNPTDIGDQNKLSILKIIKENDGISRQEISKRLNLSAPAVSKNIAALLETKIIREAGTDETSMGRKPIQLKYNGSIMYVISIEMMPQAVRGGIADLYGNEIIQMLVNKRIIIRRASRLTLYWDIFKDYVFYI